jgi:heme-degrading monooxygenase HmoA
MPALPWSSRQTVEPDRQYTAMASRLPLKSYGSIPGFLRDTMRIRRQLAGSAGLVGYGLNAQLTRRTFWTFSVWESEDALKSFAATDPHRGIVQRLKPKMDKTHFEFFPIAGNQVPLPWQTIMERAS